MRRIRFGIYSDVGKQRDEYRMKRCREAIEKARKDAGIDTAFRREDYYRRCMKDIHGGTNI